MENSLATPGLRIQSAPLTTVIDRLTIKLLLLLTELNGIGLWGNGVAVFIIADLLVTRLGVEW